MLKKSYQYYIVLLLALITAGSCKIPSVVAKNENKSVPDAFTESTDTTNMSDINWRKFFSL